MKKQMQPFETQGHDLFGAASLEFYDKENLNSFASIAPGFDTSRYDPVALKFFFSNDNPVITLYAADREMVGNNRVPEEKIPVKKFKLHLTLPEIFRHIKSFDMVLHDGNYNIEDMWVENQ